MYAPFFYSTGTGLSLAHSDQALIIGPLPNFVWVQPCRGLVYIPASNHHEVQTNSPKQNNSKSFFSSAPLLLSLFFYLSVSPIISLAFQLPIIDKEIMAVSMSTLKYTHVSIAYLHFLDEL